MSITVRVDTARGLVRYQIEGEPTAADIRDAMASRFDHDGFRAGMSVVWDLRRAGLTDMPVGDLRYLAREAGDRLSKDDPPFRVAFLVATSAQFGVSRMYAAYADQLPAEIQVFQDEAEALAWVCDAIAPEPGSER